jgi:hypothetical protein
VGAKGFGSLPFPLNGDLPWFTGSPSWANETPTKSLICVDMSLASGGCRRVPNDGSGATGSEARSPPRLSSPPNARTDRRARTTALRFPLVAQNGTSGVRRDGLRHSEGKHRVGATQPSPWSSGPVRRAQHVQCWNHGPSERCLSADSVVDFGPLATTTVLVATKLTEQRIQHPMFGSPL